MKILTGNIDLVNVNIRPDKINEIFEKKRIPFALKAGIISKLSIKMNLLNLFSDSLRITVEDILFIVGPNIGNTSQEQDFENDINTPYDENNPLNNIVKMYQKVVQKEKELKDQQQEQNNKERRQKAEEKRKKLEKKSKDGADFKEPPMKIIINLLGGLKLEAKRIHFRYEDDYFNHHKPFAFGLMIDSIIMDNSETDWQFEGPTSMGFLRSPPVNSSTINKELNVKNIKVYWNSMSEMFVPTSVYEQTRHLKYQIFEAMDASFLKEIMVDAFQDHQKLGFNWLVQPFTLYTSINLNKSYSAQSDPYKYQINTLISGINANLTPTVVRDVLKFISFVEMFSYSKAIKYYRPLFRIQSFIEQKKTLTPQNQRKRAQTIRGWFQLVLWYVRLRKSSKGPTPFSLLEIEQLIHKNNYQNAVAKVKKAQLETYEFGIDSEEEELKKLHLPPALDAYQQYEKEQKKIKNIQALRDFLTGFKFTLRLEGVKAKVFTNKKIRKQHQDLPALEFNLDMIAVIASLINTNLVAKILLKEIRLIDYFKKEAQRSFSRQVSNISRANNQRPDERSSSANNPLKRKSITSKTSFQGMGDMISGLFGSNNKGSSLALPAVTPDKAAGNRVGEIIYGQQADRQVSRQATPADFFQYDIPDPSQASNRTRETMAIDEILQGKGANGAKPPRSNQKPTFQSSISSAMDYMMTQTPTKMTQAEKFQPSPTKQNQERMKAMNNAFLADRSEIFVDDNLEQVDKRCFFAMCGRQAEIDSTISIDLSLNIFDDPSIKKKLVLGVQLDQMIIEYNNDILKNLTEIGIAYKLAFNYGDLKPAITAGKKNRKRCVQRRLQLQGILYAIRKQIIKRSDKVPDEVIKSYAKAFYRAKEKNKSKTQQLKEAKEKQLDMIQKIKGVDKILAQINFDVSILLRNIYLGVTADQDDHFVSNQTLLEFGIDNQAINLIKQDFKCKVSVFGISFSTLNSLEMLFIFANKLNKVANVYKDDLAVQTSIEHYKEFIKNIKSILEKERQQKLKKDQLELMRRGSQPTIVVLNEQNNNTLRKASSSSQSQLGFERPGDNQSHMLTQQYQKQPAKAYNQIQQQQYQQPQLHTDNGQVRSNLSSQFNAINKNKNKTDFSLNPHPVQMNERLGGGSANMQNMKQVNKFQEEFKNEDENLVNYGPGSIRESQDSSLGSQRSQGSQNFFGQQRINNNETAQQQPARKK